MKVKIYFIKQGRAGTETRPYRGLQAGLTLIELIVAMVVISVALVGVMSVINYTTRHSADPVLRQQAIAIAEAYMEEIVLKSFANPVGGYTGSDRKFFDDVLDYNGLEDIGARNPDDDDPIEGYSVKVTIIRQKITDDGFELDDSPDYNALKIEVTVTDPANNELKLTSYRTYY